MKIVIVVIVTGAVFLIAVLVGKSFAPLFVSQYVRLLEWILQAFKQPSKTSHYKVENCESNIGKVNNIQSVHNLGQFHNGIDKPIKQGKVANLNNTSNDNLNGGSLNMPPEPVVKLEGEPVVKTVHSEPTLTQQK